jgi:DNA-binding beta-propeller fold protein YncE
MTLVYTDSQQAALGLIDIADPREPAPAGFVPLSGEPTSVTVSGGNALVGVTTSESKASPSGLLAIVDLASKAVTATCDLGGQPDSLALSPDGSKLAVVIENERDEEVNDGAIPQAPSGTLALFDVRDGAVDCATMKLVHLTGLAETAPDDAEPEFVDLNTAGHAVVSLQENNHIAIVDVNSGEVAHHFSAGSVDLAGVDTQDDGVIRPEDLLSAVKREPDAVLWLDEDRFVAANEEDPRARSSARSRFGQRLCAGQGRELRRRCRRDRLDRHRQ